MPVFTTSSDGLFGAYLSRQRAVLKGQSRVRWPSTMFAKHHQGGQYHALAFSS